ncbi:LOW QUALITY PROTEIN: organic cation transporter protein-like [Penaeus monodon]|uniref:LOW QUALITY PROTEIN: organic cation transporter protein-like n=1 Tax=Penaeus monodon TaxID=6687 RepID=UPI0018A7634E|nr:LOW QUALITY PROTEIN: organic cation transporter protein-like [Penaeus monodon]
MSLNGDFDALLSEIGFGRWQISVILATVLTANQLAVHMLGSTLLSGPMQFRCSPVNGTSIATSSSTYFNNECLPPTELQYEPADSVGQVVNASVQYFPLESKPELTNMPSCPLIEYDRSIFTITIISEWHLVCDQVSLQPLYQMVYNVGSIIGSIACGPLGDKLGRRRAVQIGSVIYAAAVLVMGFTSSYPTVLAMRCLVGVAAQCMIQPSWSLAMESTPTRFRSLVGMLLGLPYSFSVICLAGIGFLMRRWRSIMFICCAPTLVLLPLVFFMDESARWLLQQGRKEEAAAVLEKAVRMNKAELSSPLDSTLEKLVQVHSTPDDKGSSLSASFEQVRAYLRSPVMRTIILVTPLLWFLQSCLYLSVAINANNFNSSNPFLYVCLSGSMDTSAILLMTPLSTRLGRRVIVGGGMFSGGLLFLLELLVSEDYFWLKWVLVMGGFLLVAGSFQMNYVYGPELFPTEIRNRGFAFVNLMGSLGFVCAPFITYRLVLIRWWVASVTFGCAAIIGSLTLPLLPETRNKSMPDTLQALDERRGKGKENPAETECINKESEESRL